MSEPITHRWDLTPDEAVALQIRLASLVKTEDDFDPAAIKTVAGIDCSLKDDGQCAIVVLSYPDLQPVEQAVATAKLEFPYIPGLLSFRESPLILAALERLSVRPDLLMLDGQGYIHPRRFGIACHIGVLTGIPALGVAKSPYIGKHEPLAEEAGSEEPLIDKGETIGVVLRSKTNVRPLYVSAGHRISLPTAVEFVKGCLRGYRLPETTRLAHQVAGGADVAPVENPRTREAVIPASLL